MKFPKPIYIAGALLLGAAALAAFANADGQLSRIDSYLDRNAECVSKEVVYTGCNLMAGSDGEYLLGQFTISDPELQMRILMQGITFFIDPTGGHREKYSVAFPAGADMQGQLTEPEQPEAPEGDDLTEAERSEGNEEGETPRMPDITPLVTALTAEGGVYAIGRKVQDSDAGDFRIWLDPQSHILSYTFVIPIEAMTAEKKLSDSWSIGLYSEAGTPPGNASDEGGFGMGGPGMGMGGPGMGGPGMGRPGMGRGMGAPGRGSGKGGRGFGRPSGKNNSQQTDLVKIMQRDIRTWETFDFAEICNL